MNNPHVNCLYYKVIPKESVDYKNATSFRDETENFEFLIKDDMAIFQMKAHYQTEDEARIVTDNFLETWKVVIGLENDPDDLNFRFDHSDIIDLDPNPSNKNVINLKASICSHVIVSDHVTVHISRNKYPSRPINFSKSPDVETMYLRYKAYRLGKESLTSMEYMCLTVYFSESTDNVQYIIPHIISKSDMRVNYCEYCLANFMASSRMDWAGSPLASVSATHLS